MWKGRERSLETSDSWHTVPHAHFTTAETYFMYTTWTPACQTSHSKIMDIVMKLIPLSIYNCFHCFGKALHLGKMYEGFAFIQPQVNSSAKFEAIILYALRFPLE